MAGEGEMAAAKMCKKVAGMIMEISFSDWAFGVLLDRHRRRGQA